MNDKLDVKETGQTLPVKTINHISARSRKIYLVFNDSTEEELTPEESQAIYNHSPDGFNWGYGGSGPAQLALAILLKFHYSKETVLRLYQEFKWKVIANLPKDKDWTLHAEIVEAFFARYNVRAGDDL